MSRLHDIIEALDTRPDLRTWLSEALADIQAGANVREALELDGASARAERDKYLRQAACIGPWATRYQAALGIEAHVAGHRGQRLDGAVLALLAAAERSARIPRTWRRLLTILEIEIDVRIQRAGVTDHGERAAIPRDRAA